MNTLTREDILSYLRENRAFLNKKFGVTKIALFGSYARNEARLDSDIDLLIEVVEEDFTIRFHLKKHLEEHFNKKVDVGYFTCTRIIFRKNIEEDIIYA